MSLAPHTAVLLRWPDPLPAFSGDELDALQERHLAYLAKLRESGALLASGPFDHQPDQRWRGPSIFAVGLEEAGRVMANDPSVRAGRLEPVVFTWLVPEGLIAFPGPR